MLAAIAGAAIAIAVSGCTGSSSTAPKPTAAAVTVAPDHHACAALASWEATGHGSAWRDVPLVTVLEEAPAPLGTDATTWVNDMQFAPAAVNAAAAGVIRDCQRAGVASVLGSP